MHCMGLRQVFLPIMYLFYFARMTSPSHKHADHSNRQSFAYTRPFTLKLCAISQQTLISNRHQTRTTMLQHSSDHQNAFIIILPHYRTPTQLTIDAITSTTATSITSSPHYHRYMTPLLLSLNPSHHCRSSPPSGPTGMGEWSTSWWILRSECYCI